MSPISSRSPARSLRVSPSTLAAETRSADTREIAVALRPLDRMTYIPQVQHWAQCLVRMNLAEVSEAGALPLIKALVEEWKPVSRHAIWQLWLALVAQHKVTATAGLRAFLPSTRLYPWESRSLSGYADAG